MIKKAGNIVVYILIAVIIWQGFKLWQVTKRLDDKIKNEIKAIDSKIKEIDNKTYQIEKKIAQARKNDTKQQKKITFLISKLKRYEKKTNFNHISNNKDSIRQLLTE